jgi:hypothetical protein
MNDPLRNDSVFEIMTGLHKKSLPYFRASDAAYCDDLLQRHLLLRVTFHDR